MRPDVSTQIQRECIIDGTSVLARLPYPSTQPRRLAVASEVATMNFAHTLDVGGGTASVRISRLIEDRILIHFAFSKLLLRRS
ncbi:hypothetical protein P3342_006499 [Pyrenophora teres f. teres]|nr:hypothetical protein P3342_006499 [Pyrenophora teres f. teres]